MNAVPEALTEAVPDGAPSKAVVKALKDIVAAAGVDESSAHMRPGSVHVHVAWEKAAECARIVEAAGPEVRHSRTEQVASVDGWTVRVYTMLPGRQVALAVAVAAQDLDTQQRACGGTLAEALTHIPDEAARDLRERATVLQDAGPCGEPVSASEDMLTLAVLLESAAGVHPHWPGGSDRGAAWRYNLVRALVGCPQLLDGARALQEPTVSAGRTRVEVASPKLAPGTKAARPAPGTR
jgi:hypothetical protein